ncbi:MAG TPA: phospholipase D-like domain-containing protein [Thermoanaerobaculia bacterium]|nr:phospholipase D-like domain-containing protein [Thermoanaerobaculia bacterium]
MHPRVGEKLPRALRVGRVGRLAGALPLGVEDPDFEVLLRRIDRGPIFGGNRIEVFTHGADAFAAMRQAALAAGREILLESYIFKDDSTGRLFLEEAVAAARRGLAVRVMADAAGSFGTRAEFWDEMERRGVEVRLFNPLYPRFWWFQPFRDHRKILVVDRQVGFTGGMNIGEEYGSPRSRPGQMWRDTHVRVEGPAAWEMAVVFAEGWTWGGGQPFDLERLAVEETESPGARILVLDSRPWRGASESAAVLAAIVGAARRTVWITNAYFAPGRIAVDILGEAVDRGVDVRLLLPGWTDVPLLRHAAHGYYADLLARGVRIFEYGGHVLHAKSLVADGYVSVVGSTNLDFRSFVFNAECNLVVLDRATAATLEEIFQRDLEMSEEILMAAWRRRPVLHRLGDRMARWLSPVL